MKQHLALGLIVLMLATLACQATLEPTPAPLPSPSVTPMPSQTPLPLPTETPTITPTPQLSASNGPALLQLNMFSSKHGWGLMEDQILVTNDGGAHWAQVPLPGATVDSSVSAYFLSAEIAYFFAPVPNAQIGQFFATHDGGATWNISLTQFTNAKLYFVNENTGFAFQTLSIVNNLMTVAIYQTLDRGATWAQVFIHTANQGDKNLPVVGVKTGMSFIDANNGFIGLLGQENSLGLYHAIDAGRNWSKQDLAPPAGIGAYQSTVWPPLFLPENWNDGFLPVDFISTDTGASTRVFYITHDLGATWEKGGDVPDGAASFFIDPQNGWVWGGHSLYATHDGAKTWNEIPAAFGRSERAAIIDFVDLKYGWLVTVDAKNTLRMYRTTDGGNTWAAIIA